jgi:hypothetical protein
MARTIRHWLLLGFCVLVSSRAANASQFVTHFTRTTAYGNVLTDEPGAKLLDTEAGGGLTSATVNGSVASGTLTADILARARAVNVTSGVGFVTEVGDTYEVFGGPYDFDTGSGMGYEGMGQWRLDSGTWEEVFVRSSVAVSFVGELAPGDTLDWSFGYGVWLNYNESLIGGPGSILVDKSGTIAESGFFSYQFSETTEWQPIVEGIPLPYQVNFGLAIRINKRGEGRSWVRFTDPDFTTTAVPAPSSGLLAAIGATILCSIRRYRCRLTLGREQACRRTT